MEIHINRHSLKKEEVDVELMLRKIATGKAILFTGAGFSIGSSNVDGEAPPIARKLSKAICNLGGFPEDEDLRYSADYYIESGLDKAKLIGLLKRCYTLSSIGDAQKNICIPEWRRFYTTNYDKGIEIASSATGRVVECIDVDYPTTEYYKREHLCVHLNGSIDSLTSDSLENSFKLSTSSYISADSFTSSDWYYYFKKDLERSSAIVFVGYSMYDIEIQKVLFEGSNLKDKTYFITRIDPDAKLTFTLSKFGHVLPIGVEGFSELISNNVDLFNQERAENDLQSLCEYEISIDSQEITDSDVETFLMYGDIDDAFVDNAVAGRQRIPYLILRDALTKVLEFTEQSQNTLIYAGLGNGKTVILRELKTFLTLNAIRVFSVDDLDGDCIGDFDVLAKTNDKIAIIIDGYEPHLDLLKHYTLSKPKNICIIAASRTADHERLRVELGKIGFLYNEVSADELSHDNASYFVSIIDNVGMWGNNAGLTHEGKIDLLSKKNSLQISLSLLYLFDAPQIKDRIQALVQGLFRNEDYKSTVFSISFLEVLDLPAKQSLISEVAENNTIYTSSLRENQSFRNLFKIADARAYSKSSLFSLFLIKTHFSPTYITAQLHRIAGKFNAYSNKDYVQERIFKATLRFSFIERLLPDTNKKSNLRNYYEKLKVIVPWLKRDPHFWLQYGMSNIPFKEYGKAQSFIDQAYSLAEKKYNYYITNIDTQQARLLILMAIVETDKAKVYPLFEQAHKLLSKIEDDIYKYRQVEKYNDFYDSCYNKLSGKNKVGFISACKSILSQMDAAEIKGMIDTQHNYVIKTTKEKLLHIILATNT
jgi:hypothetical protein